MNSITEINNYMFNNKKILIILDNDNNPWFRGKDITDILEYSNTKQAIRINVDEDDREKLINLRGLCDSPLTINEKNTIFINESGLYSLMMSSKKEEAKKFKKWVTSEVLPSIRKHGEYKLQQTIKAKEEQHQKEIKAKDEQHQKEIKEREEQLEKEIKEKQEKEIQLQKEIKLKEDYKEYCNRIQSLEKNDIIYILTNNTTAKQNIFKLGKTTIGNLKNRLATYNTGAVDPYYYVYYKEVYNAKLIEKCFNNLMNRYNVKINNKINKEIYQIYLPYFIFYLKSIIKPKDYLIYHLEINHEKIFLDTKNKQSKINPVKLAEEIQWKSFDDLNDKEKIKIITEILLNCKKDITRKVLENIIETNYNLVINKRLPIWKLTKEINKKINTIKVTY